MAKPLEFHSEFQEFERWAPRSFKAWAVDNLWISLEFGEFGASEVVEKSRPLEANLMKKK